MKHRFSKLLLWGILINLLLIGGIYKLSRSKNGKKCPSSRPISSQTVLLNFHYTEIKNNKKCWEVNAKKAIKMPQNKKNMILSEVRASFYSFTGTPVYLRADRGILNTATKDMTLEGHVYVWQKGGNRFRTTRLFYDASRHLLYTDMPVDISGPKLHLQARKMRFFINQNKLVFLNNVKTKLKVD